MKMPIQAALSCAVPALRNWQRASALSLICCVLAAQLFALPAAAKPLAQNASAEHIRALHADASQKAWRLVYRSQDQSFIEFVIWQDYAKLTRANISAILDFKWKRVIQVSDDGDRYFHSSLHKLVGFRDLEYQHRVRTSKALDDLNEIKTAAREILDPFWRASDLGFMRAPVSLLGAEIENQTNGGITLTYDGETAFEFRPAVEELGDRHNATFYRTLRHMLAIHPSGLNLMAEQGHPPALLKFKQWHVGELREEIWSLETAEQLNLAYPLRQESRPDIQLLIDRSGLSPAFLDRFMPILRDVVSEEYKAEFSGWEDYRKLPETLISDGQQFDGGMLLIDYMIRYGVCQHSLPTCGEAQALLRSAGSDTKLQTYFAGFSTARKDPDAAIAMWQNLDRKGSRFGYMVDLALGNAYEPEFIRTSTGGRPQDISRLSDRILDHFDTAFRGNPLNSSVYKDIG
ncbi:MAG: hypothetical protein HKN28_17815, partial [Alphaproteobacteria bacterium]|nr:hypothetical protein [Alphaproteobacteria bacterium]